MCYIPVMRTISVSEFKQTCLRLLEEVHQTGQPIRVTKRGVPIAEVVPASASAREPWRGCLQGTVEFSGDVVAPASEPGEWEVLDP